jgi:hypothetical protein
MLKNLTTETIGNLSNGQAGLVIDAALKKAIDDLEDRGEEDGKARSVKIEIAFQKFKGQTVVDVVAEVKMPNFRTDATIAEARYADGNHKLFFQDLNAENPEQPTFRVMDEPGKKLDEESGEVAND